MSSIINDVNASILFDVITILVPVRKFKIDFEFTTKTTVPAIIETTINLAGILGDINREEIIAYFGLNDRECDVLINDAIKTGYVSLNNEGGLSVNSKYHESKKNVHNRILLDEFENHFGNLFIDCVTYSIHAIEKDNTFITRGLKVLDVELKDVVPQDIFVEQFQRYKDSVNRSVLQSGAARIYKINRCEYDRIEYLPVSISFSLKHDMDGSKVKVDCDLTDSNSYANRLVKTSGLMLKVIDYLNDRQAPSSSMSIESFINYFKDDFLKEYMYKDGFNFENYASDKLNNNIKSNLDEVSIIGPIYLENNRNLFHEFISDIDFEEKGNNKPIIWKPSNEDFWGASKDLKSFDDFVGKLSEQDNFELSVCLPNIERNDKKEYKNRFKNFLSLVYLFDFKNKNNKELTDLDILVFDGDSKFAMVQYNYYDEKINGGLPIKVGYLTRHPEKVERIISFLKNSYDGVCNIEKIIPESQNNDNVENISSFFL
ncbi:hypothetical protein HLH91_19205 [Acinetobacter baumannii]|nr:MULTISPECIES: hypothetical protein [Acinetobacter]KAB1599081.1 hypothetical protein F8B18_18180 [Acinetobacter baumannii]MBZ0348276.1 hypothetical protein [Acinetobacter baumannii]MCD0189293.1 hypothetical protein [Acinetobacter sp. PW68]HCT6227260.1 hypothetical protein [Acinetobacter baumannii]HDI2987862.1 hypothetical protein [Acinetobacter baumannii]